MRKALVGLLLALVLFPAAALAANQASYGFVTFYTDKPRYLPGEPVKFTIVLKDKPNFNSQIYIWVDYYNTSTGQWENKYFWIYPLDNGTAVIFNVKTVDNDTIITFTKSFDVSGQYRARLALSGYNIPANALTIEFTVAPQYQISGQVVSEKGTPVPGATVVVKDAEGNVVATATTDDNGYYVVSVPGPGTYKVCAFAARYLKNATMVEVTSIGVTDAGTLMIESIDHAIATLRSQVVEIQGMLESLAANVSEFQARVDAAIMALNETTIRLEDMVAALEGRVGDVEQAVQQLQEQLQQLQAQVEQAVQQLQGQVQQLSARLDQALAQIDERITNVENRLAQVEQEVQNIKQNYATKQEVDQLRQQVEQLSNKYNQLEARVGNIEKTVAGLQQSLDKVNQNLANLQQSLQDLMNKADSASRTALIAVVLAIIGIIIAIIATVAVYRKISA